MVIGMSAGLLMALVTLSIAAFGVLVYLWTAGASLIMAIEIHTLRVETHQLRIQYARKISELTGEPTKADPEDPRGSEPDPAHEQQPPPAPVGSIAPADETSQRRAA